MTDEELIAGGKILCISYYLANDYSKDTADKRASEVTTKTNQWAKQAQKLGEMGHPILGGTPTVTGQVITGPAFLRQAEQLAESARITLEAVEKQPEVSKKDVAQWRFTVNCFFGAIHKRGLIPDLKDGGPGAY